MDTPAKSRFEQLIGDNMEAFLLMLEGALKEWDGTHDILALDTRQYLLRAKKTSKTFSPFCARLRQDPMGEKFCLECDLQAIGAIKKYKEPSIYPCHAGLRDVAVPIQVHNEILAVIFCGQVRPTSPEWDEDGRKEAERLEKELGIPSGDLIRLRDQIPQVSYEELEALGQRIMTMAHFVSQMLEANLDLQQANKQLQRIEAEQKRRLDRNKKIEEAVSRLFSLSETWDDLWKQIEEMLKQVTEILQASHGVFLLHEIAKNGTRTTTVRGIAYIPSAIRRGKVFKQDNLFDGWDQFEDVQLVPFTGDMPDTLCSNLQQARAKTASLLESFLKIRVRLDNKTRGLILFFFEEEMASNLNIDEKKASLNLIGGHVARSYANTKRYLTQVTEAEQRREWLKMVSHQIIAPLNGLIGYAGVLTDRFEQGQSRYSNRFVNWPEAELFRWHNALDSIVWTTDWAARLTRNLAWMANLKRNDEQFKNSDMDIIYNVPDFIIECARFVQGLARERKLRMVHVIEESLRDLDGRLHIHKDYFRQALLNLLDNAVKYSNQGTDVILDGHGTNGHCRIRVINYGARLIKEECDHIFDYEYRTAEARRRYPTGTGIGLPIAREIIVLHGGKLTVHPSEQTASGWQTIFIITLPLAKGKRK